jgi:hypothetical protein
LDLTEQSVARVAAGAGLPSSARTWDFTVARTRCLLPVFLLLLDSGFHRPGSVIHFAFVSAREFFGLPRSAPLI